MAAIKLILTVFLVAFTSSLVAAESESQHVTVLTAEDYAEKINDGKVYFVKYYAPWCGHCKRLAPVWDELAEELSGSSNIVIANIDCTVARDTCQTAQVKGYPTLKVMHKGEEVEAYRGARDLSALKKFIEEKASALTA